MDYSEIKKEYETKRISFKKLGETHKTHYKKIERVAKKEKWIKYNPTPQKKKPTPTTNQTTNSKQVSKNIEELLKAYYQPTDEVLILAYIDSYQSFLELQEAIKNEGKFIDSSKGTKYMNPKYSALQMEKMNLIKIGKELGITLSSRIRLQLNLEDKESEEPSIFDIIQGIMDE